MGLTFQLTSWFHCQETKVPSQHVQGQIALHVTQRFNYFRCFQWLKQWAFTFFHLLLNIFHICTQRNLFRRLMSHPYSFMNYSLSVCGYIIHLLHWITFDRFVCQNRCLAYQCVGETQMKQWGCNKNLAGSTFILKCVKLASMVMQRKGMNDKNFLSAVSINP